MPPVYLDPARIVLTTAQLMELTCVGPTIKTGPLRTVPSTVDIVAAVSDAKPARG